MEKYTEAKLPFSQRLENFWFYNKGKVLIAGFFLIATVYTSVTVFFHPKADYKILLSSRCESYSNLIENMQADLEQYGRDQNGDGRVTVEITDCCETGGNSAASVQFYSYLEIDDTVIYLLDSNYQKIVEKYFRDEQNPFVELSDGGTVLSLDGSDIDKKYGETYGKLSFMIRNPEKADIDASADEVKKASVEFVRNAAKSKRTAE